MTHRIGLDIGGTKIAGCVLDQQGSAVRRVQVPAPPTFDRLLAAVAEVVAQLGPAQSLGIGVPGIVRRGGDDIQAPNLVCLNGQPFVSLLGQRLGIPVAIDNDAACFALSEALGGAADGARVVLGVTLGTGVGSGLVIEGRPFTGATGAGMEWGHCHLPDGSGLVEHGLAGPAVERAWTASTGQTIRATDIADRAQAGDDTARAVISQYVRRLSQGLADLVNLLDPDVIVLGGSLSAMAGVVEDVAGRVPGLCHNRSTRVRVVRARFGPDSGARGAALLPGRAGQSR